MLKGAIIWHLWCARCGMITSSEEMNVFLISHKVWNDNIYIDMAHGSHIMSYAQFRGCRGQIC